MTRKNFTSVDKIKIRSRIAWIPAIILVGPLLFTPLLSWLQNIEEFPVVCFAIAGIMFACAFYFFSFGDTICSCAISLRDQALFKIEYSVTTLTLLMTAAGFVLIWCAILAYVKVDPGIIEKILIWAGVITSPCVFLVGFILQMRYSHCISIAFQNSMRGLRGKQ